MPRTVICKGKRADGTRCVNPTSAPSGYCGEHGGSFGARFRRTATSPVYRTRRWRNLSASFRRDWVRRHGLVCGRCRKRLTSMAELHAGHLVAFEDGADPYDLANLVGLCGSCNARQSLHDRAHRR